MLWAIRFFQTNEHYTGTMEKSQPTFTYSESRMETPEQCVKSVQINNQDTGTTVNTGWDGINGLKDT